MKKFARLSFAGLSALFTFYSNNASAQFEIDQLSLGASLGYTTHGQNVGGSLAMNVRTHYEIDESYSSVISFTYQMPTIQEYELTANALSNATTPRQMDAKVEQSISFYSVNLDFHRYFVRDIEDDFGIYGLAGAGLAFANRTLVFSGYDKTLYTAGPLENASQESFSGFMINLGIGSNINFSDKLAFFGEVRCGLPAGNKYNSQGNDEITNPLPFNFGLQAGVRFNLFD